MGKVKNGKPIHLQSVCTGQMLHSNMAEGGMCSWGGPEHTELGWRLFGEHFRIKDGGQVVLMGIGNTEERAFMHSNAEEVRPRTELCTHNVQSRSGSRSRSRSSRSHSAGAFVTIVSAIAGLCLRMS